MGAALSICRYDLVTFNVVSWRYDGFDNIFSEDSIMMLKTARRYVKRDLESRYKNAIVAAILASYFKMIEPVAVIIVSYVQEESFAFECVRRICENVLLMWDEELRRRADLRAASRVNYCPRAQYRRTV